MTAPLCFLDTETDGVHPGRQAWEIALIRREPNGHEQATSFFVQIDLANSDPSGLRIGRFYERHPLGRRLSVGPGGAGRTAAKPTRDAAMLVAQHTHGAHIVGAVPNFDTEALAALLRREGLAPAWHYHLVDVENLAVGWLAGHGTALAPPWNSDDLTDALGLAPTPPDERHTALGDARWAQRIYDRVMRLDRPHAVEQLAWSPHEEATA